MREEAPFADEFELKEELGRGHYSIVWCAQDVKRGGDWAVKVIDKTSATSAQLGDVMQEIAILERLNPAPEMICGMARYYSTDSELHIVMEIVAGGPLFNEIIRRKHYSEKDAALLSRHLVDAVDYMASKAICHRDLKPENVLLLDPEDPSLKIKVVDFGFAEVTDPKDPQLQKCCGTPLYIAPEILNCGLFKTGDPYSLECDMWSVGIIVYILCCGYPPFKGKSTNEQFKKVIRGVYTFPPNKVWGQVSDTAKEFIQILLVLDPKQRATPAEARKHKWLECATTDAEETAGLIGTEHLMQSIANLKDFNAQQKWRKGIFGVDAITRMRYATACMELQIRPNSDIERLLTEATQDDGDWNTVDLSRNYLGPKGLMALMPLLENKPRVQTLVFGQNGLNNAVMEKLCQVLKRHPGVTCVDLSNNPISHMAGRFLLSAVQTNPRIVDVSLDGTALQETTIAKIDAQLDRNRKRTL